MPDGERIHSVGRIADRFNRDVYSVFEDVREKDIVIWQPEMNIDAIGSLPAPEGARPRVNSFLTHTSDCDLAVAPEWSYDVKRVPEDRDKLFADDSPLFVLGCRPVEIETMRETVESLRDEGFRVISEDTPDDPGKEFVTPTIVPLRADALGCISNPTVVIQYKNQPMSESANPNEADNLATGTRVHHLGPLSGTGIIVWTCSDLLDEGLREQVSKYIQRGNILVQPQCNPKPFHSEWTDFRSKIFNNRKDVTYVSANWSGIPGVDSTWGYSGVYTKAREWSSLENYDQTYNNKGLQGVDEENRAEYVWTLVDDGVSRARIRREGVGPAPAQGCRPEPQILNSWTWDGERYSEASESINECGCEWCDDCNCSRCSDCRRPERERRLPESPRDVELVAAVGLCELNVERIDELESHWDVPLVAVETLQADGEEKLGHAFAAHEHRHSGSVRRNTKRVLEMFDVADNNTSRPIEPVDECSLTNLPINVISDDGLDISLSRLDSPTPGDERRWLTDMRKWIRIQGEYNFKPFVLTVSAGTTQLKRPEGWEDVTSANGDPEDVAPGSPQVELAEVDQ